ncbi:MAG TPA: phosphatase PAP2 family protein [Anaerolineaceae bacterium]
MNIKTALKRIPWVMIPVSLQLLYFFTNRYSTGGYTPDIWLDRYIPVIAWWSIPYLLTIPYWVIASFWLGFKIDFRLFRVAIISATIMTGLAQLIYLLAPTYVVRPEIHGEGFDYFWLNWIYTHDDVYNALPSGHAYVSTLLTILLIRLFPRQKLAWIGVLAVIVLSALFTHQHYILDLVVGVIYAIACFALGSWLAKLIWGENRSISAISVES